LGNIARTKNRKKKLCQEAQGPEFKPQNCQKKKEKGERKNTHGEKSHMA
jgi:hypothetical protein